MSEGKQFLLPHSFSLIFYCLFVTLFTMSLITGENNLDNHIISGYILGAMIFAKILIFIFRGRITKMNINSSEVSINMRARTINYQYAEQSLLFPFLSMLTSSLIFLAILSGLLSLAYGQRLGPLFSVIDYFPIWVFVTVNGIHEFVAYAATFFIILFVNIKLFGHYWNLSKSSHSNKKIDFKSSTGYISK